jgi:prophage maintenance system killer protein
MVFELTKKDIIALNQQFEDCVIHNESSLDFALSYAKKSHNWTKSLAYLVRAILIDHVFQDGNKRSAALLIKTYIEYKNHKVYDDKVIKLVKKILIKNITSIKKTEDLIKDVIR